MDPLTLYLAKLIGAVCVVMALAMISRGPRFVETAKRMAADDRFTKAKWADADVNLDTHALFAIQVTDFEVLQLGTLVTTGDTCVRNP